MTETIILSWIMLVFFAAAYQMFIVNETIYRSMTAVHANLMNDGFDHNCYRAEQYRWNEKDPPPVDEDLADNAHVIWREHDGHNTLDIPEVRIIVVRMFRQFGLPPSVVIRSNVRKAEPSKGCDVPCKKTKMVAGAGGPSTYYTHDLRRPLDVSAVFGFNNHSLYGRALWAAGKINGEWIAALKNRTGL